MSDREEYHLERLPGPGESIEYVAQYIPFGGRAFTDLKVRDTEAEANAAISENILGWQAREQQGDRPPGRPRRYRVIRRTVMEEVLSEREDGGAPLSHG